MPEGKDLMMNFGDLFHDEPEQWGLRGDPYLWRELREKLAAVEFPKDVSEARNILETEFCKATGQSLLFCGDFSVERFAHGGMSSGAICGNFWRERGIPMIIVRYTALMRREQ